MNHGATLTQDKAVDEALDLTTDTPLPLAAETYNEYMSQQGFSQHTIKAFAGDLRLLQRYFGNEPKTIGTIGTKDLNEFLTWLLYQRGVPCSPKSYARRVTTLKNFFGWLDRTHVLPNDPARALIHIKVKTPLPAYLTDEETGRLLDAAEQKLNDAKPDARPYLLTHLVLQTAMKKAECVNLALKDIDTSPDTPSVFIRYNNPRLHHKERRLFFAPDLLPILEQYSDQYSPEEYLFECTPRNLEYVLTEISEMAKLPQQASFEMLRWTSALRDYRDNMEHDKLRHKLGLSKITWRESEQKLAKILSESSQ